MENLITVIIPAYNVEETIEDVIKSVLVQTYKNFEIIIIDDGSTDGTYLIIKKLSELNSKINVYRQKNKGVSAARNKGISLAKGEYIYFLDGDDYIEPNLFEKAIVGFQEKKVEMFSFGYVVEKKDEVLPYSNFKLHLNIFSSNDFLKSLLSKKVYQSICSFIIKKEMLSESFFNTNLKIGEDLEFQYKLLLEKNFNVLYDSHSYFHYINNEKSVMNTKQVSLNFLNSLEAMEKLREKMLCKGIKEFRIYQIINFFYLIRFIAINGINDNDFYKVKKILRKHDYILRDLYFSFSRRIFLLNILKVCYHINLKFLFVLFKIAFYFKINF